MWIQQNAEAERQRDRIVDVQETIIAQASLDAERDQQRDELLLAAVQSIVAAERTVTQRIVRREVQAGPTQTVTKTARATVTETETIIRPPGPPGGGPPPFLPSGCIEFAGVEICRTDAAMGGLLLGLSVFGFVGIRRATS